MIILYIIGSLLIFLLIVCFVIGYVGYKSSCVSNRNKKTGTDENSLYKAEQRKKDIEYLFSYDPQDVSIQTPDGLTLRAWYVPADVETKKFVICVHGHNCTGPKECGHFFPFYHNELKVNYLLPDLRGHGRSDGNTVCFGSFDHKDIKLWADYLINRFGSDIEIVLHGVSMGAATVMLVNNDDPQPQIKAVIEDCGYSNALVQIGEVISMLLHFKCGFLSHFVNFFCKIKCKYDLKKDADPLGTMKNASKPTLFIHGEADDFVPSYMCDTLYDACPVPKEKFIVPNAVHAFSYYVSRDEYNKKVSEFLEKYVDGRVAMK